MISFFRSALSSWLVLGVLGLALVALVVTGLGTPGGIDQLSLGGDNIARVGRSSIPSNEAATRVQAQFDAERQQNPNLDMAAYVRTGRADNVIEQMINARALQAFGHAHGMAISDRSVDAELANIQAFRGPTGSFDRATFLSVIAQRKLSEDQVRSDIARDKLAQSLIVPAAGASRMPVKMVTPYAGLLLEARQGQIAEIPAAAIARGAPPSQAELDQFYARNTARYTVPETRSIRYALFDRGRFEGKVAATDAEIAAAYKAEAAKYQGRETRVFTRAVVQDEAKARAIAAAVRSGTSFEQAAKANGGEATTLAAQDRQGFAGLASTAAANVAFSATKGAVLDPQKTPFGWAVIRVDTINTSSGRALDQVRGELATAIEARKLDGAVADFVTGLEDQIADGATFDEVVKKEGLTVVTTPAVTGGGIAPNDPGYKADPALTAILKDAFQAEPDDDAAVVTLAPGRAYAFYDLERVVPSAPRPLSAIRAQVLADFEQDRASKAARRIADGIVARANKGTPLAQAVSGAGIALPAPRPIAAKRMEIARAQGQVPPPVALLFSMAANRAKLLEMPGKAGWYVVRLDKIEPGNVATAPGLVQATQQELARVVGEEYVAQFAAAIRKDRGVSKNDKAIANLKRSLTGGAPLP